MTSYFTLFNIYYIIISDISPLLPGSAVCALVPYQLWPMHSVPLDPEPVRFLSYLSKTYSFLLGILLAVTIIYQYFEIFVKEQQELGSMIF